MLKPILQFVLVAALLCTGPVACCGVITWTKPPAAPCDIQTLMVDEAAFPKGWKEQGPPRPVEATVRFGVEKMGTGFSTSTWGTAIQQVYRASDTRTAATGYRNFMSFFALRDEDTEWRLPSELDYSSQVADQFRLGCSANRVYEGVERCLFIGQYDVYLVRFHTYMSPDLMTYADLRLILQDIDGRMAECLGR